MSVEVGGTGVGVEVSVGVSVGGTGVGVLVGRLRKPSRIFALCPLKTGLLLSAGEVGVLPVIVGVLTTAAAEGMPTAKAANATAIAHVAIRIRAARRDDTLSPGG